jgi:hypothetical protein
MATFTRRMGRPAKRGFEFSAMQVLPQVVREALSSLPG